MSDLLTESPAVDSRDWELPPGMVLVCTRWQWDYYIPRAALDRRMKQFVRQLPSGKYEMVPIPPDWKPIDEKRVVFVETTRDIDAKMLELGKDNCRMFDWYANNDGYETNMDGDVVDGRRSQ